MKALGPGAQTLGLNPLEFTSLKMGETTQQRRRLFPRHLRVHEAAWQRERSGDVLAGAWALAVLQSILEERANNHGHQTQPCRAPCHPTDGSGVVGAEVSVAA